MFVTVGGVICQCGVYNGSNHSLFGEKFCAPSYYITRADNLLRVRMILFLVRIYYYACGSWYDLLLRKKIVLLFLKVSNFEKVVKCFNNSVYFRQINQMIIWTMIESLTNSAVECDSHPSLLFVLGKSRRDLSKSVFGYQQGDCLFGIFYCLK